MIIFNVEEAIPFKKTCRRSNWSNNLLACLIFRISYSCLNWLDSSVCWKNSLSNFPSICFCGKAKRLTIIRSLSSIRVWNPKKGFRKLKWLPEVESNFISVRDPEAIQFPVFLGPAAVPSGIASILSESARTKSLRVASSSVEIPLTYDLLAFG